MNTINNSVSINVLQLKGLKAYILQVGFLGLALLLPYLAHIYALPVRWILPMQIPIIISALMYGWQGGLLIGACSPLISFALSGMPMIDILPAMFVELSGIGFITGILYEKAKLNPFISLAIGIVSGKILFILSVLAFTTINSSYSDYFIGALLPGMISSLLQIILLPFFSRWFMNKYNSFLN